MCVDDSKRCGFTVGSTLGQGITGHLVVYLSAKLTEHCQDDPIQAAACQVRVWNYFLILFFIAHSCSQTLSLSKHL